MAYPFSLGGGEKRNWEIARRLVARGHKVSLLCVKMWDGPDEMDREGVRYVGVCPWKRDLCSAGKRSMQEPFYFGQGVHAYLSRNHFDVVDCANFPYVSCISAAKAVAGTDTRLVVTWYETRGLKRWLKHRGWKGLPAWLYERRVSSLTRHNIAISDFTAERARRMLGMRDIQVVPCGVDMAQTVYSRSADRGARVLYVGRLTRHKNVDMLIRAFGKASKVAGHATLKIVGRGIERPALERLAGATCPAGQIVFADSLEEYDLRREYSDAAVFVLPSEQEGFGIVLLEAMAAGTPVVALSAPDSAAGALIRNGENGMLVCTETEMSEAISVLLADPSAWRRYSESGRATARSYDWDSAVVTPLEQYYRG